MIREEQENLSSEFVSSLCRPCTTTVRMHDGASSRRKPKLVPTWSDTLLQPSVEHLENVIFKFAAGGSFPLPPASSVEGL